MARTRCFAGHDRPPFFTDRVIEWLLGFTPRERRRACSTPWTWLQANARLHLGAQSAQDRRDTAGAVSRGRSKSGPFPGRCRAGPRGAERPGLARHRWSGVTRAI